MTQMAFDFDLEVTTWEPVYKPFGGGLLAMVTEDRCRDCGTKCGYNQGGTQHGVGMYMVCDDCAAIDACSIRPHTPVVERRPGQDGIQLKQAAHCENCGWWIDVKRWGDAGKWVKYTPEEVLDLCAEHARPRHTSHWGVSHDIEQHDGLVARQAKRRAKYLAALERAEVSA